MSLPEDIANHLADMPNQALPIYPMQFPGNDSDGNPIINCVAIFPSGAGVNGNIGIQPGHYTTSAGTVGALDYPGFQVQVRYTDTFNAFTICETIRKWLDFNPPTGYLLCSTGESQPRDLTNGDDLKMVGGPCYRWETSFGVCKVRA